MNSLTKVIKEMKSVNFKIWLYFYTLYDFLMCLVFSLIASGYTVKAIRINLCFCWLF